MSEPQASVTNGVYSTRTLSCAQKCRSYWQHAFIEWDWL